MIHSFVDDIPRQSALGVHTTRGFDMKGMKIVGFGANDTAYGGAGNDTITVGGGNDIIDGGSGRLSSGWYTDLTGGDDVINAGAGDDIVWAGGDDDTVLGGAGDDSLYGQYGEDSLNGGMGNDSLDGGVGNDSLNGGMGNDLLYGGMGSDTINGGAGNDTIWAGIGDTINSGLGADMFRFGFSYGERGPLVGDVWVAGNTLDTIDFNYIYPNIDDMKIVGKTLHVQGANTDFTIHGSIVEALGGALLSPDGSLNPMITGVYNPHDPNNGGWGGKG